MIVLYILQENLINILAPLEKDIQILGYFNMG